MENVIEEAKAEYIRAKERLSHNLATTADDKIDWSPSPTARTPVQLVAHGAIGVEFISELVMGKPFGYTGTAELDSHFRKSDKEYTTREQALSLLEQTSTAYIAWLDSLTPEQIASTVHLPFGDFPMTTAVTFAADHLRNHAGQIEYVQTIYGDRDWHM